MVPKAAAGHRVPQPSTGTQPVRAARRERFLPSHFNELLVLDRPREMADADFDQRLAAISARLSEIIDEDAISPCRFLFNAADSLR